MLAKSKNNICLLIDEESELYKNNKLHFYITVHYNDDNDYIKFRKCMFNYNIPCILKDLNIEKTLLINTTSNASNNSNTSNISTTYNTSESSVSSTSSTLFKSPSSNLTFASLANNTKTTHLPNNLLSSSNSNHKRVRINPNNPNKNRVKRLRISDDSSEVSETSDEEYNSHSIKRKFYTEYKNNLNDLDIKKIDDDTCYVEDKYTVYRNGNIKSKHMQDIINKENYKMLTINNIPIQPFLLVALCFLQRPKDYYYLCFKNINNDFRVDNLEWRKDKPNIND